MVRSHEVALPFDLAGEVEVKVENYETGEIRRYFISNTVTNYARQVMAKWLIGTNNTGYNPVKPPSKIALGTGAPTPPKTGPDPTDTALWSEKAGTRKAAVREVYNLYYAQYIVIYTTSDPADTYKEAGLFDDDGNLWGHVALSNIPKSALEALTVLWKLYAKLPG